MRLPSSRFVPLAGLCGLPAWAADRCPDLTALQRAAGLATWQNLMQLAGAALVAAGILFFASGIIRRLLLRERVIEAASWGAGLGALAAGAFVPDSWRLWPVLSGSLVLPAAAAFSLRRRLLLADLGPVRWGALLALFWAVVAVGYQQQAVGFLAVAATLAVMGLFIGVGTGCYVFGFRDRHALLRGTLAGAGMTAVFAVLAAARVDLGMLEVLGSPALWLGAFAWVLGVLILSVKRFAAGAYLARQAVALLSMAGALAFGLVFAVRELVPMAGTFQMFYLGAKVI